MAAGKMNNGNTSTPPREEKLCVFNLTREAFLSLGVSAADTHWGRLRGLVGRVNLPVDEGLWVVPCQGVHTLGVLFPIDLIYLDSNQRVIHLIEHFEPFRVAPLRRHAASVLELPVRTIYCSNTQVGDQLMICTLSHWEEFWGGQTGAGKPVPPPENLALTPERPRSLLGRLKQRFSGPKDRRVARRRLVPGLAAFYFDGLGPHPHFVQDISTEGAFLKTNTTLYPGTVMNLCLQRVSRAGGKPAALPLRARVVRCCEEGMAVRFMYFDAEERQACSQYLDLVATEDVRVRAAGREGNSLIEFALVLPLLLLLIVNVVNFAGLFYAWITVSNAVRTGADYQIQGGATIHTPRAPAAGQVTTLISQDCNALPNKSTLRVRVCTNTNGTVTCSGTGSGSVPADPEAPHFATGSVDVTYTYQPLLGLMSFPGLGIYATLPPTQVHRQAVMRMMQ